MTTATPQQPHSNPTCMTCGAPVADRRDLLCKPCQREHRLLEFNAICQQAHEAGTYDYQRIHDELKAKIARERAGQEAAQ